MDRDRRFRLIDTRGPGLEQGHLVSAARSPLHLLATATRLSLATLSSLIRLYTSPAARYCRILYLPYPAVPALLLFSLIPARREKRLVADGFISLYDTVVRDRRLLTRHGRAAKLLFRVERWALDHADLILTDTDCNKRFLQRLFRFSHARVKALPLATDEAHYLPSPYQPSSGSTLRVLFIATFAPLHGADIVAEAALLLAQQDGIEFRWFGDGQTAGQAAERLRGRRHHVAWQRLWTEPEVLMQEVSAADVCLGIFGRSAKAARVLPLKTYLALRVGRAVISAASSCWPGLESEQVLPYRAVPANDARSLALAITELAERPAARMELAAAGRRYYEQNLANQLTLTGLFDLVSASALSSPP
jgi:glycosyltransferase involved in cell wall biosynthesis